MGVFLRYLLLPFSWVFSLIVRIRRVWYSRQGKRWKSPVPVVVVGNVTTGGTGKTPHAALVAEILLQHGKKAAWLSRGYGRKTTGFLEVRYDSDASQTGDEPLMVKQKYPEMPVYVCENRPEGIIQLLVQKPEVQCVVLDDAYQHLSLKPHLAIVLITWQSLRKSWLLLPAGNAREPLSALRQAQIVIVTKCPDVFTNADKSAIRARLTPHTDAQLFYSSYRYLPLLDGTGNGFVPRFDEHKVLLLSAIADSKPIELWLTARFYKVAVEYYPDHYAYTRSELEALVHRFSDWYWVITEKDAVRIREVWPELLRSEKLLTVRVIPDLGEDTFQFEKAVMDSLKS